jgi:hypothetical protein
MELECGFNYLTETIKHIQILFGGNNQIPELAYLSDTQLLRKFDSGNYSLF